MVDYEAMHLALVRTLMEIADNPSATERMVNYDKVARAGEWWARRGTQEDSDG